MSSIYEIQQQIKRLFANHGYSVYDIISFDANNITRMGNKYPIILVGRNTEVIDNDGSPTDFLDIECEFYVNVVVESDRETFESECSDRLREIKDIIGSNFRSDYWCNWYITENFIAELNGSNDFSSVYGGLDITTTIEYREKRVVEQRPLLLEIEGEELQIGDEGLII